MKSLTDIFKNTTRHKNSPLANLGVMWFVAQKVPGEGMFSWRQRAGSDEKNKTHRRIMAVHRKLCLASFNRALATMLKSGKSSVKAIEKFYARYGDHGATAYQFRTKPLLWLPFYQDRFAMGHYVASWSGKMTFLAGMLKETCLDEQRKVIMFMDWPATQ